MSGCCPQASLEAQICRQSGHRLSIGYGQSVWAPQLVLLKDLARLAIFNLPNTKITAGLHQSFFQGKGRDGQGGRAGFGAGSGGCSGCVWWVPHLCPLSIPSLATAALMLLSGHWHRMWDPCSSARTFCCAGALCPETVGRKRPKPGVALLQLGAVQPQGM